MSNMINQQLLDYINQQLTQGIPKEIISRNLISQGWDPTDVNEGFSAAEILPSMSTNNIPDPTVSPSLQQNNKSSKKILIGTFLILGIIFIGVGIFASMHNTSETPEEIREKMLASILQINSFTYTGEITGDVIIPTLSPEEFIFGSAVQEPTTTRSTFLLNLDGGFAGINQMSNSKAFLNLAVQTDAFQDLFSDSFSFELKMRIIGDDTYFSFANLPNLGFFDLNTLSNRWYQVNLTESRREATKRQLEAQKRIQRADVAIGGGNPDSISIQVTKEEIDTFLGRHQLTQEKIDELKQVISQSQAIRLGDKIGSEVINGVGTHHFTFTLDEEYLEKLVIDSITLLIDSSEIPDADIQEIKNSLKSISNVNGEIWIGKSDYLPYKITTVTNLTETTESDVAGEIGFTLTMDMFNKPIEIETPTSVGNIEELMEQLSTVLFSLLFSGAFDGMNDASMLEVSEL
jgi:hypothetical protein